MFCEIYIKKILVYKINIPMVQDTSFSCSIINVVFISFIIWHVNFNRFSISQYPWICGCCNLYCHVWPYAGLQNVLAYGLACHMLVSVCWVGSNLNVHAKPEKMSWDIYDIWIHLLVVKPIVILE